MLYKLLPLAHSVYQPGDQILKGQHSVVWIPYNFPGQGNILLFNNFHTSDYSSVLEIVPPIDQNGSYLIDQVNAYDPNSYYWIYTLDHLAAVRGGVWRLPNGNTIITTYEQLFEIGFNLDMMARSSVPPNSCVGSLITCIKSYSSRRLRNIFTSDKLDDENDEIGRILGKANST